MTGHGVTIIDGTSEHLYGLATAAEVPAPHKAINRTVTSAGGEA